MNFNSKKQHTKTKGRHKRIIPLPSPFYFQMLVNQSISVPGATFKLKREIQADTSTSISPILNSNAVRSKYQHTMRRSLNIWQIFPLISPQSF